MVHTDDGLTLSPMPICQCYAHPENYISCFSITYQLPHLKKSTPGEQVLSSIDSTVGCTVPFLSSVTSAEFEAFDVWSEV